MRVNIYIPKELEAKWLSVEDRPALIRNALEGVYTNKPVFKQPEQVAEVLGKDFSVCEHGAAKGFCKFRKCKFFKG